MQYLSMYGKCMYVYQYISDGWIWHVRFSHRDAMISMLPHVHREDWFMSHDDSDNLPSSLPQQTAVRNPSVIIFSLMKEGDESSSQKYSYLILKPGKATPWSNTPPYYESVWVPQGSILMADITHTFSITVLPPGVANLHVPHLPHV